jgi:hypothetical protein
MRQTTQVMNAAVSGAATYYSAPSEVVGNDECSYHTRWTGTPVATSVKVLVSNIYEGIDAKTVAQAVTDNEFEELPLTGGTIPAGSADGEIYALGVVEFRWVVLQLVNASGTGTFGAYFTGKRR